MQTNNFDIKGLSDEEVLLSREKYGKNTLKSKQKNNLFVAIISLAKDYHSNCSFLNLFC